MAPHGTGRNMDLFNCGPLEFPVAARASGDNDVRLYYGVRFFATG